MGHQNPSQTEDQVHDNNLKSNSNSNSNLSQRGHSKAQMCLFKILTVIKLIPPPQKQQQQQTDSDITDPSFGNIDLKLRLGVESETRSQSEALSACSAVGTEKSSVVEAIEPDRRDPSGTGVRNGEDIDENPLRLLLEAAEMIENESDSEKASQKNRDGEKSSIGDGGVEETMRSKRKRSSVLPWRYRDSVVFLGSSSRLPMMKRPQKSNMVSSKRKAR